jgi:hypothetical protein
MKSLFFFAILMLAALAASAQKAKPPINISLRTDAVEAIYEDANFEISLAPQTLTISRPGQEDEVFPVTVVFQPSGTVEARIFPGAYCRISMRQGWTELITPESRLTYR